MTVRLTSPNRPRATTAVRYPEKTNAMNGFHATFLALAAATTLSTHAGYVDERAGGAPPKAHQSPSHVQAPPALPHLTDQVLAERGARPATVPAATRKGKNVQIGAAVKTIVPKTFTVTFDSDVGQSAVTTWATTPAWPDALRTALSNAKYSATLDWSANTLRIHATNRAIVQAAPTPNSPPATVAKPMPIQPLVPPVPIAKQLGGPVTKGWVLTPQTMLAGVRAIAHRHGYTVAEEQPSAQEGNKITFSGTLTLEGASIEADMQAFTRAANAERVTAEIDIYTGNKRILPKFYTGEAK